MFPHFPPQTGWVCSLPNLCFLQGVHEPVLHLTHLREGDYAFTLEVTDTAGQKSSDEVHVFVKASENEPPVAKVAANNSVVLPGSVAVLDGSGSSDDNSIVKYQWSQIRYFSRCLFPHREFLQNHEVLQPLENSCRLHENVLIILQQLSGQGNKPLLVFCLPKGSFSISPPSCRCFYVSDCIAADRTMRRLTTPTDPRLMSRVW